LGTTVLEAWTAALFLTRRQTLDVSRRWQAWLAAPVGSFAMLLARPAESGFPRIPGQTIQLVGTAIALLSLTALGRSFGVVAANRGVKTAGLYRFVRHPAYAGYMLSYTGYVLENLSAVNACLLLLTLTAQVCRIREEERVLGADERYDVYRRRVRYRLIPHVY
jgi:protein-S-isoprenylcysteine O-methyltransferase Ste14